MITANDIIKGTATLSESEKCIVDVIVANTANTWQANRSMTDIERDTVFGKLGERFFMDYLDKRRVKYADWDELRHDSFLNHTSLDGFVTSSQSSVDLDDTTFASEVNRALNRSHLNTSVRDRLEAQGVAAYEVKSTRIAGNRLLDEHDLPRLDVMLNDDFLAYPTIRSGILTEDLKGCLLSAQNKDAARAMSPLIMVRAYLRTPTSKDSTVDACLVGWIDRDSFYDRCTVKGMLQRGKSEKAIYYALQIKTGRPMSELNEFIERRGLR